MAFEDVTITWEGKESTIPRGAVMDTIARVEGVLTLSELSVAMVTGRIPLATVCKAYGILLRSAGFAVTDEEVYDKLFNKGEMQRRAANACAALQMLMIPPERLRDPKAGKEAAAGKRRAGSSRKSTSS